MTTHLMLWMLKPGPPQAALSVSGHAQSQSHPSIGSVRSSAPPAAAVWLSFPWQVAPCHAHSPSPYASVSERTAQTIV